MSKSKEVVIGTTVKCKDSGELAGVYKFVLGRYHVRTESGRRRRLERDEFTVNRGANGQN